jgi:hypothetical protein
VRTVAYWVILVRSTGWRLDRNVHIVPRSGFWALCSDFVGPGGHFGERGNVLDSEKSVNLPCGLGLKKLFSDFGNDAVRVIAPGECLNRRCSNKNESDE